MRYARWLLVVVLGLAGMGAFTPVTGLAASNALLRLVHASPDAPELVAYLDDQPIGSALKFTAASDYISIPVGTHRLQVFALGTAPGGKALLDTTNDFRAGEAYTVVAADTVAKMVPVLISDGLIAPPADQSSVRLFHASPDAPGIADVAVAGGGPVVFKDVAFRADTAYLAVPPGSYSFDIRPAGTTQVVATTPQIALVGGATYTVFAMGKLGDNTFQAIIILDKAASGGVGSMPSSGGGGMAREAAESAGPMAFLVVLGLLALVGRRGFIAVPR